MNKHSRVCANIDLSAIMHNMEAMHQNIDPNTKIYGGDQSRWLWSWGCSYCKGD